MRIRRRRSALLSTALLVAVLTLPIGDTTLLTAQSPGSSISSTSGPVQWDFQPVIAGQVTNLGAQDVCPPGLCDNHDLVVTLPAPAATFYTTNTAKLTIKYTWSSSAPTDIDIFAISPTAADHGPGDPDGTFTGPSEETLTVTDPLDGLWHIRSMAALSPLPTSVHAVASLTVAQRPSAPIAPPPPNGAPTFVNYFAPEDCPVTVPPSPPSSNCITPSADSTTASGHDAGEPSIGVNWKTGNAFNCRGSFAQSPTRPVSIRGATLQSPRAPTTRSTSAM